VLAAVVRAEPDWSALPAGAPLRLLHRCLEKDPARRLRDIGDARILLEGEAELTAKTPSRKEEIQVSLRVFASWR